MALAGERALSGREALRQEACATPVSSIWRREDLGPISRTACTARDTEVMANFTSLSAQQAYERAGPGEHVIGWQIDRGQRRDLLSRLPPRYAQVVADHVTSRSKVAADAEPPAAVTADIVGRSDDGLGVEAMVVRIDGRTSGPAAAPSKSHGSWSRGASPARAMTSSRRMAGSP